MNLRHKPPRCTAAKILMHLLLLSALLGGISGCTDSGPTAFNAIDVSGADYARDFALTDHNGKPRTLQDFRGKIVAIFFGYTQCPDVCPTSLAELAAVKKQLGPDADKLQGLFVTVDPERDTPAIMKSYMANFDPDFLALYAADAAALAALAKDYKVYYKKVPGQTPGSYTMDHSAGMYIYDTQGRLRLYTRYGSGAQALLADIKRLLRQER